MSVITQRTYEVIELGSLTIIDIGNELSLLVIGILPAIRKKGGSLLNSVSGPIEFISMWLFCQLR